MATARPVQNLADLRYKLAEKLAAYENGFIDGSVLDKYVNTSNGICKAFMTEIAVFDAVKSQDKIDTTIGEASEINNGQKKITLKDEILKSK